MKRSDALEARPLKTKRTLRLRFGLALGIVFSAEAAANQSIAFKGIRIPNHAGKVMTVEGLVEPKALGTTLPHEHVFIDQSTPYGDKSRWPASKFEFPATDEERLTWDEPFTARTRGDFLYRMFGSNRDVLVLESLEDAVAELESYRAAGGTTLVDTTTLGLGRNPDGLREASRKSGVRIVMGAGFYRKAYHPADIDRMSIDDLTERMVREIVEGVDDTGVRAGIIGEIGAEDLQLVPSDSNEVRVLRAAARASRLTGAAITLHNYFGKNHIWHTALDVLEKEGADLSRVIMGHVTADSAKDLEFVESLLRRGVYVQFDTLGAPFAIRIPEIDNRPNIEAIFQLIKRGYSNRILVSQDVCTKYQLKKFGGFGYTFVLTQLVPYLRGAGVGQHDIDMIVRDNPARLLTFVTPRPLKD